MHVKPQRKIISSDRICYDIVNGTPVAFDSDNEDGVDNNRPSDDEPLIIPLNNKWNYDRVSLQQKAKSSGEPAW